MKLCNTLFYFYLIFRTSLNTSSLKDAKSGTASVAYIPLPSERVKYGLRSVISNVSENERFLKRKRLPTSNVNNIENKQNENIKSISKPEGKFCFIFYLSLFYFNLL
jgi:hypothetical protein